MRHVLSTGRKYLSVYYSRYDNEFVKGGAKEVGCQEIFEPYKKCIMVEMISTRSQLGLSYKAPS